MKRVVQNVITFMIIAVIIMGGFSIYRSYKHNKELEKTYDFVISKFTEKNELVVADATVDTNAKKTFTPEATKEWPSWIQPLVKLVSSRRIELKIPVKTEFKLVLNEIDKDDISIKDNKVTFRKPLTVNVDSQIEGDVEIVNSSNGLLDKAADMLTSGKSAQEFLNEKAQDTVYDTSEYIMEDKDTIKKVVKSAQKFLEEILNISSSSNISVELTEDDLTFVNVDKKSK